MDINHKHPWIFGPIVPSSAKRTNERDEAVAIRRGEKMQEVRHVKKMDGLGAQRG